VLVVRHHHAPNPAPRIQTVIINPINILVDFFMDAEFYV
jgi:hypothetical protein